MNTPYLKLRKGYSRVDMNVLQKAKLPIDAHTTDVRKNENIQQMATILFALKRVEQGRSLNQVAKELLKEFKAAEKHEEFVHSHWAGVRYAAVEEMIEEMKEWA